MNPVPLSLESIAFNIIGFIVFFAIIALLFKFFPKPKVDQKDEA